MRLLTILFFALSLEGYAETPSIEPSTSEARWEILFKLWGDKLHGEKKDNFWTHLKRVTNDTSEQGRSITKNEYEELIKLSQQKTISEYIEHDSANRPPLEVRRRFIEKQCETMTENFRKRCERKLYQTVDLQSESEDEISNVEWDELQVLIKKIQTEMKQRKPNRRNVK